MKLISKWRVAVALILALAALFLLCGAARADGHAVAAENAVVRHDLGLALVHADRLDRIVAHAFIAVDANIGVESQNVHGSFPLFRLYSDALF